MILGEDQTSDINSSFGSPEKRFDTSFSKKNTKFSLSLHYNGDNSYSFFNEKEICKFKANIKNAKFPKQFFLGSISNKFGNTDSGETDSSGNVYNFSLGYSGINKSDILNFHKYLIIKSNMYNV